MQLVYHFAINTPQPHPTTGEYRSSASPSPRASCRQPRKGLFSHVLFCSIIRQWGAKVNDLGVKVPLQGLILSYFFTNRTGLNESTVTMSDEFCLFTCYSSTCLLLKIQIQRQLLRGFLHRFDRRIILAQWLIGGRFHLKLDAETQML